MARQLEKAIGEMRELPEPKQEVLAEFIADIVAERRFDRLLESPQSVELLTRMAEAALQEHRRGETMNIEDLYR